MFIPKYSTGPLIRLLFHGEDYLSQSWFSSVAYSLCTGLRPYGVFSFQFDMSIGTVLI